jgi:hypothetical protein
VLPRIIASSASLSLLFRAGRLSNSHSHVLGHIVAQCLQPLRKIAELSTLPITVTEQHSLDPKERGREDVVHILPCGRPAKWCMLWYTKCIKSDGQHTTAASSVPYAVYSNGSKEQSQSPMVKYRVGREYLKNRRSHGWCAL